MLLYYNNCIIIYIYIYIDRYTYIYIYIYIYHLFILSYYIVLWVLGAHRAAGREPGVAGPAAFRPGALF